MKKKARPIHLLLVGFFLSILLFGSNADASKGRIPWSSGAEVHDGWVVLLYYHHPEYVRYWLGKGTRITCVELRYRRKDDPEAWTTRYYRTQPCPDFEPRIDLIRALHTKLELLESLPTHRRFVVKISSSKGEPTQDVTIRPITAFFLLVNFLAVCLFVWVALCLFFILPGRKIVVAGAVVGLAAPVLILLLLDARDIPAGWISVLHEGLSSANILQLYGRGVHAEENFFSIQFLMLHHRCQVLQEVVLMNICLAAFNTVFFFVVAYSVLNKLTWAAVATFMMAFNLNFVHSLLSELPAQLLSTYFLMGVCACGLLNHRDRIGRASSSAALTLLLCLAILAFCTRMETGVLSLPALAVGFIKLFGYEGQVARLARRALSFCKENRSWFVPAAAAASLLATFGWLRLDLRECPPAAWAMDGLFPFNPSFLTLPYFLFSFISLGFIFIFVLGLFVSFRRLLAFFFLPLATLILFRVYYSASHGRHGPYYERFRYLCFLMVHVSLLSVFGLDWLRRWLASRRWSGFRKRSLAVLVGVSFLVWTPFGWSRYFGKGHDLDRIARPRFLLGRNQQTETRYLLLLTKRFPDCIFVSRTLATRPGSDPRYRWVFFGQKIHITTDSSRGLRLEEVAARRVPKARCLLFYRGLDCNRIRSDGCVDETSGRKPLDELVFPSLRYNDAQEWGTCRPVVHLGVYPIRLSN